MCREGRKLLERDETIEVRLAGEVDQCHPATPQFAEDLVACNPPGRLGVRAGGGQGLNRPLTPGVERTVEGSRSACALARRPVIRSSDATEGMSSNVLRHGFLVWLGAVALLIGVYDARAAAAERGTPVGWRLSADEALKIAGGNRTVAEVRAREAAYVLGRLRAIRRASVAGLDVQTGLAAW